MTATSTLAQRTDGVTVAGSLFSFYDIESLANVFTTAVVTPRPHVPWDVRVFYLVDPGADGTNIADQVDTNTLGRAIMAGNPALPRSADGQGTLITFHDLRTLAGTQTLAATIGLSDADDVTNVHSRSSYPSRFRPVCDTDPDYDPMRHPFLTGYNSQSYDTTMLALFFMEACLDQPDFRVPETFQPVSARRMRQHNDQLFTMEYMPRYLGWGEPAAKIRNSMIRSGRHIDAARLNEAQHTVALKRLLGMMGRQIKESDKLSHDTTITTVEDLYELLVYNVSDCLGLSQLFKHSTYSDSFDLKAGLLTQYSETRYDKGGSVRRDRLSIDSSSAKFVGRILAPYRALDDIETVSFQYPHPKIADELGVKSVNVLDEAVRFFDESVCAGPVITEAQASAREQFMQVVEYYRSIEGKNFNDSEDHVDKYGRPALRLADLPKAPNNIPYFRPDGTPSSCFVTFSTGGIHGAEADMSAFAEQQKQYTALVDMIAVAKTICEEPSDFIARAKAQHNLLTLPDGSTVDKAKVLVGSDPDKVRYRKPVKGDIEQNEQLARAQALVPAAADLLATQRDASEQLDLLVPDSHAPSGWFRIEGKAVLANTTVKNAAYRDVPAMKKPELFPTTPDGQTKLNPKFVRTSAAVVAHEDFTSYYPNLLRNMMAFYNPELGEDRYANIFFQKEALGAQMKQPGISQEERARLKTLREGTKLILNSASGAGDAGHSTPIKMNNRIISMRLIGQLFSWRIGMAQTLNGARIISTNTDGLYSVIDPEGGYTLELNNQVLAREGALIGVEIEPELMGLVSKDSNNRLELAAPDEDGSLATSEILSASGGTLACYQGPTPRKALAHPAVIDHALARYLRQIASRGEHALAEPFDEWLGRSMIDSAVDLDDPVQTLCLFQNVLAASRGSITYQFAAAPLDPEQGEDQPLVDPTPLQMVNRVFIVKAGTPGAVSLHNARAQKISADTARKRERDGERSILDDRLALAILKGHGWVRTHREADQVTGASVLPADTDAVVNKISRIDRRWSMVVINDDLHTLGADQLRGVIDSLDLAIYTQMLGETYSKNWMNATP